MKASDITGVGAAAGPTCAAPYCDRPAVAAVHVHGATALVRPDHLRAPFEADYRCLDCMLDGVEAVIARST